MTAANILNDGDLPLPLRGRRKKGSPFLVLATILLVFAAAVGAGFLVLRPTTLRIAVGPPGSDDHNLVQALAETFTHDRSSVRLSLVPTAGPLDSIAALAGGKADLAVARTDEELPEGTDSVAILRKNVVVLWAPSGTKRKGAGKEAKAKIKAIDDLPGHRIAVVGRTDVNIKLLRVILTESGVNPDKV